MRPTRYSRFREESSVIFEDDNAKKESSQPSFCFEEAVDFVFAFPSTICDSMNPKEEEQEQDYRYDYIQNRREDRDLPMSRRRGERVDWRELRE